MDPIIAWHTEHTYFHQLLGVLHKQVDLFHRDERPNYELMQDIIGYLREYSDRFHHPREDVAFACLAKRCPDLALVLARLGQEHRVIAHAGEALLGQLRAIVGGAVVPRAAKMLTPEDWDAVRKAVQPGLDPLFGGAPEERFRELRRQIALEA